jgi:hypothetical protein
LQTLVISENIAGAMDALVIGSTLALSFATTMLVGKALLHALVTAMQRSLKSVK